MTGHLHIELAADAAGRTFIRGQSFHAPMHLSKPHWDGNCLVVQAVNCTAGLFGGDRIDFSVHAGAGTRALVTSPSAQRAYPARTADSVAWIEQRFTVEPGAWLETFPEIFIPHRGARVRQNTRIDAQSGAELFYLESLAPGRVGAGEAFAYERLEWLTELFLGGKSLVRERYALEAGGDSVELLRSHFPDAYYASGYLVSPKLPGVERFRQEIAGLGDAETRIAASFPVPEVAVIKILAG
ncbi:MAG TPA: urease accessory protein UreD, partial [Chthoniobacterales bacterium]